METLNRFLRENDMKMIKQAMQNMDYDFFVICNSEVSQETVDHADIVACLAQLDLIYVRFDRYNNNFKELANSILHESYHVLQWDEFPEYQKNADIRSAFEKAASLYGNSNTNGISLD
jgi:hypothetical protein